MSSVAQGFAAGPISAPVVLQGIRRCPWSKASFYSASRRRSLNLSGAAPVVASWSKRAPLPVRNLIMPVPAAASASFASTTNGSAVQSVPKVLCIFRRSGFTEIVCLNLPNIVCDCRMNDVKNRWCVIGVVRARIRRDSIRFGWRAMRGHRQLN